MSAPKEQITSTQIADVAVQGMLDRKGQDICLVDLRNIGNSVCDYFVICHGSSNTNVEAIANSVEESLFKTLGEKPWHREGTANAEWILQDYFNVVVHVFQKSTREFYNLEELWADAEITHVSEEKEL